MGKCKRKGGWSNWPENNNKNNLIIPHKQQQKHYGTISCCPPSFKTLSLAVNYDSWLWNNHTTDGSWFHFLVRVGYKLKLYMYKLQKIGDSFVEVLSRFPLFSFLSAFSWRRRSWARSLRPLWLKLLQRKNLKCWRHYCACGRYVNRCTPPVCLLFCFDNNTFHY